MKRVIVIGLDGATWDLLKPWADKKELKNIGDLIKDGVWGNLISTIPFTTGPAWTSFSTGKNPGKHGIFDFVYLQKGKLKLHSSSDIKSEPVYEILSHGGIKSIIIGLPLSFPPSDSFNGIMLSDFLFHSKAIFPPEKEKYLKNYEMISNILKRGEPLLEDIKATTQMQMQTAKELFLNEKWQFFFFLISSTDHISHYFWDDINQETTLGKEAKRLFYMADEMIGWIKYNMQQEDFLFIISDHGFGKYEKAFHINQLLKNTSLLKTKIEMAINPISLKDHINKLKNQDKKKETVIVRSLIKILNSSIIKKLYRIDKLPKINKLFIRLGLPLYREVIDFKKSSVYNPSMGTMGLYINLSKENESLLINKLNNLKYRGELLFKKVIRNKEIYNGKFSDDGPQLLLIPNKHFITSFLSKKVITPFSLSSFHRLNGIFMAYGYNIKRGKRIEFFNIYDLAPTILHIFGLLVPSDMDGAVLKSIFNEDSEIFNRPIRYFNGLNKVTINNRKFEKI
jgi:predicted AlkP superfamily phosphohydrolase/phosphomutase